ncbi:MAG TPA: PRC-barrel domain-containing protein [Anaerolineales bacterium]|nr:PRC-barrel domain-containing protein [Anaerolineales bacterium]
MRKTTILLSTLVLAAMVLAACGAEETTTPGATVPPITMEATATDDMAATEAPTMEGTATDEPGVPITGEINPARVSNQLDFSVWTQDGKQIGEVEDMIIDLDNRSVAYVIVGTGGFLEIGEKEIAVPWESLELRTGIGTGTSEDQATSTPEAGTGGTGTDQATATPDAGTSPGASMGDENAFILLIDQSTFENAPEFDPDTLPEMGRSAADWDVDIRNYWQGGGTGAGQATADPNATTDPNATAMPEATATTDGTGTDQGQATATQDAGAGQGQIGQAQALQGVMLASDILGATLTLGTQGQGTGQDQATADPNATVDPNATATSDAGAGMSTDQDVTSTVEDLIVDTDAGDVQYIVVNASFTDGERWIPVPLGMFQWDAASGSFILNADGTMLQNAPSFQEDLFPDTSTSGWNSEFDSFWQNSEAGGGGGANPTATP